MADEVQEPRLDEEVANWPNEQDYDQLTGIMEAESRLYENLTDKAVPDLQIAADFFEQQVEKGIVALGYPDDRWFEDLPLPLDFEQLLDSIHPGAGVDEINQALSAHCFHGFIHACNEARPHAKRFLRVEPNKYEGNIDALIAKGNLPEPMTSSRSDAKHRQSNVQQILAAQSAYVQILLQTLEGIDGALASYVQRVTEDRKGLTDEELEQYATCSDEDRLLKVQDVMALLTPAQRPAEGPDPLDRTVAARCLRIIRALGMAPYDKELLRHHQKLRQYKEAFDRQREPFLK